jgi:hypothetical protein
MVGIESVAALGSLTIASMASIRALYNAYIALRAKRRMRELIRVQAKNDKRLLEIVRKAATEPLTPAELSEAISRIQATATVLPERDREILEVGMHQHSADGTKRFVKDVLAPA